ncbi:hypothetical protein D3C81_767500 [compost metagenome]
MTFPEGSAPILTLYVVVRPPYVRVRTWLSTAALLSNPLTISAVTGTVVVLPSLQLTVSDKPSTLSGSPT